ncbi:MAG: M20 metallopeptidase family protein [Anaerolineae bacterium]
MTNFLEKATEIEQNIIKWRREIHKNPELGFEEIQTANLVASTLNELGIEAEVGVGRTGVVARIGDGQGPKIGIRADMDALPIHEAVDLEFKSQVDGKMHACGHDAHTAMLLGVAQILRDVPDMNGEVRLLFQPSEERWDADGVSGATAMIDDRALDDLDHVISLHVDSTLPVGEIKVGDGFVLAAVDTFDATIFGEGTHGASPHMGVDPIWIQSQVISAIQGVRARQTDPTSASVITIGAIHAGVAPNVIPDKVEIRGTIRSFDEATREQLHQGLDQCFQIARALGGDYQLSISRGYPALYNDPGVASLLRDVSAGHLGKENAHIAEPKMGAEDFSYMTQKAPGAMLFLGAKYDDQHRPHHSPIFALGEDSFKYGTAILAETALRLMRK